MKKNLAKSIWVDAFGNKVELRKCSIDDFLGILEKNNKSSLFTATFQLCFLLQQSEWLSTFIQRKLDRLCCCVSEYYAEKPSEIYYQFVTVHGLLRNEI